MTVLRDDLGCAVSNLSLRVNMDSDCGRYRYSRVRLCIRVFIRHHRVCFGSCSPVPPKLVLHPQVE